MDSARQICGGKTCGTNQQATSRRVAASSAVSYLKSLLFITFADSTQRFAGRHNRITHRSSGPRSADPPRERPPHTLRPLCTSHCCSFRFCLQHRQRPFLRLVLRICILRRKQSKLVQWAADGCKKLSTHLFWFRWIGDSSRGDQRCDELCWGF